MRRNAIPRIGFLTPGAGAANEERFWAELRRLGYVDGKNIAVEYRSSQGDFARLPALAAELVRLKVSIIVAVVTQASLAAKQATATIPIVMIGVVDPVAAGLVSNLARPGGNITGTSGAGVDIVAKQLELVRTLLPNAARVAGALESKQSRLPATDIERGKVRCAESALAAWDVRSANAGRP
jgi:putative ABC transport system substrate-binding protein